jgi:hypothetical protein
MRETCDVRGDILISLQQKIRTTHWISNHGGNQSVVWFQGRHDRGESTREPKNIDFVP